jgi:soluble lytic murein transglycosylase
VYRDLHANETTLEPGPSMRHFLILLLFVTAAVTLAVLNRPGVPVAALERTAVQERVPREVMTALEEERFLRASMLLREHLRTLADTTPGTILIAAEAEAGWGDWERVVALLRGRVWLDSVGAGRGWSLLGQGHQALGDHDQARRALARYLDLGHAGDRERGIAEMRLAVALTELDSADQAAAAYQRAAPLLPEIDDWVAYFAAAAAAEGGDTATVRAALADIPDRLRSDWGWRLPIRARRNAGDTVGAIAAAEAVARGDGAAGRRAEAWASAGAMRLARGESEEARQAFRTAMDLGPGTGSAIDAARALSEMSGLSLDDRLDIGRIYLRHGNVARGVEGIEAYLEAGAGSAAQRLRLRLDMGRALFNAGRYRDAERALLAVAEQSPQSSVAADALFLAGRAQYRSGREEIGRGTFLRVAERYPGQVTAARALYLSADLDHDDGNLARASERYRQTIRTGVDVDEVGLAYMRLAGIAFAAGDFGRALEQFEAYRTRYPNGQRWNQATYWAARAHERLGDEARARALLRSVRSRDPYSYYGGRAAELLGEPFWHAPLAAAPAQDAAQREAVLRALAPVDLLRQLSLEDAASYELGRVRERFAGNEAALYALAEALNARGTTTIGIGIGWDLYRRADRWNERLLRIIYPFPYRDIVVAEAERRDVDPFLAAGLIRQESMFSARAVSPAGAIGLMQVMPETGAILARELDVKAFTPELLKKPEFNVTLGIRYLADQLDAYDERLPVVLSAYNAGPARVARWRTIFPEFSDDELFSERIPFEETREYVKIVQQNRRMYRALYGAASPATAPGTGR